MCCRLVSVLFFFTLCAYSPYTIALENIREDTPLKSELRVDFFYQKDNLTDRGRSYFYQPLYKKETIVSKNWNSDGYNIKSLKKRLSVANSVALIDIDSQSEKDIDIVFIAYGFTQDNRNMSDDYIDILSDYDCVISSESIGPKVEYAYILGKYECLNKKAGIEADYSGKDCYPRACYESYTSIQHAPHDGSIIKHSIGNIAIINRGIRIFSPNSNRNYKQDKSNISIGYTFMEKSNTLTTDQFDTSVEAKDVGYDIDKYQDRIIVTASYNSDDISNLNPDNINKYGKDKVFISYSDLVFG